MAKNAMYLHGLQARLRKASNLVLWQELLSVIRNVGEDTGIKLNLLLAGEIIFQNKRKFVSGLL